MVKTLVIRLERADCVLVMINFHNITTIKAEVKIAFKVASKEFIAAFIIAGLENQIEAITVGFMMIQIFLNLH